MDELLKLFGIEGHYKKEREAEARRIASLLIPALLEELMPLIIARLAEKERENAL